MFQLVKGSTVIGILFFAFLSFWPAIDQDHKGTARVIDADTIEIDGNMHRDRRQHALPLRNRCR